MSISPVLSRSECIKVIENEEIKQLTRASIEHFAIPIIRGFSMDEMSQLEFEEMGGKGEKPKPLKPEAQLEIYTRIKKFITEKLGDEIASLVNSVLEQSLARFSDEELRLRVTALNQKVVEIEPNWQKLPDLFNDHLCLFKELQKRTLLKVDVLFFHEKLCPMMCRYRDSGELFARIKMKEFL